MLKLGRLLISVLIAVTPFALRAQTGQDFIVDLLLRQEYGALEKSFAATQQNFENGELTEYELRQTFEPFAKLTNTHAREKLDEWVARFPRSYVANLALGLNYRAMGSAARGRKFWDDTSAEKREGMVNNFALAEPLLRKSITLTSKPYLSVLNLMTIAGNSESRPFLNATLMLANESLPSNFLARANYARYLLPRWGGSYEKFDAFLAISREQGVAESTLLKLQAIELNDRGMVLAKEHDSAGADAFFKQALQLWPQSGDEGDSRASYLATSIKQVCKAAADEPACQPSEPLAAIAPPPFDGQMGFDLEHSIVIPTEDEFEGVRTEYAWLALRYPGARRTLQALVPRAGRHYDMLAVTTADGRDLKLYFDITAMYDSSLKRIQATQADQVKPGKN